MNFTMVNFGESHKLANIFGNYISPFYKHITKYMSRFEENPTSHFQMIVRKPKLHV